MAGDAAASDITEQVPIATNDATLNAAGGPAVATISPYGEIPFTPTLERTAGMGGIERVSTTPPSDFGRPIARTPRAIESGSGRHQNTAEILGGK